mmetsp:Transcript_11938/g.34486  ORF Transcript_11938/g.34486 Transcript_11938/m.34486 type:complete len:200 (+) Transcript_11938:974-1573(+)
MMLRLKAIRPLTKSRVTVRRRRKKKQRKRKRTQTLTKASLGLTRIAVMATMVTAAMVALARQSLLPPTTKIIKASSRQREVGAKESNPYSTNRRIVLIPNGSRMTSMNGPLLEQKLKKTTKTRKKVAREQQENARRRATSKAAKKLKQSTGATFAGMIRQSPSAAFARAGCASESTQSRSCSCATDATPSTTRSAWTLR